MAIMEVLPQEDLDGKCRGLNRGGQVLPKGSLQLWNTWTPVLARSEPRNAVDFDKRCGSSISSILKKRRKVSIPACRWVQVWVDEHDVIRVAQEKPKGIAIVQKCSTEPQ